MLVYSFDRIASFPLLESYSMLREGVMVTVETGGRSPFLRLRASLSALRKAAGPKNATVVLALPLKVVAGRPARIEIEVLGDGQGHSIWVDAMDGTGVGCVYRFAKLDSQGWTLCSAEARKPVESWGGGGTRERPAVVPPLQFQRLGIVAAEGASELDVGLRALRVTGEVRLAPPGIADSQ